MRVDLDKLNELLGKGAVRIQIAVYDVLQAEVIVHRKDADRVWSAWAVARYHQKPIGGAIICDATMPRQWNVPVGSLIPTKKEN